jgi:hypothetical protein
MTVENCAWPRSAAESTLSMVLPVIDGLNYLMQCSVGGLDVLRQLYVELLDEKFGDLFSDRDLCVATTVDLRLKTNPFENETHKTFATESTVDAMMQIAITPLVNQSQRATQASSAPLSVVPSTANLQLLHQQDDHLCGTNMNTHV